MNSKVYAILLISDNMLLTGAGVADVGLGGSGGWGAWVAPGGGVLGWLRGVGCQALLRRLAAAGLGCCCVDVKLNNEDFRCGHNAYMYGYK